MLSSLLNRFVNKQPTTTSSNAQSSSFDLESIVDSSRLSLEKKQLVKSMIKYGLSFENKVSEDSNGFAYLPKDFVWPIHNGRKLTLFEQVLIEDLIPFADVLNIKLPNSGVINLFFDTDEDHLFDYDESDVTKLQVRYTSFDKGYEKISNELIISEPISKSAELIATLPQGFTSKTGYVEGYSFSQFGLSVEESDIYGEDIYEKVFNNVATTMFGYPIPHQHPDIFMEAYQKYILNFDSKFAAISSKVSQQEKVRQLLFKYISDNNLKEQAKDWIMLFQRSVIAGVDTWGTYYVYINPQDLAGGNLENSIFVYQT